MLLPPDAPIDAPPFTPAPHSPLPVMFPHAGRVLQNVRLVTLTFDGYAARADVELFGATVVGSAWFTNAGAEYGVGPGSQVQAAAIGPAPTNLDRATIRNLIANLITVPLIDGPDDPNTDLLYLLYVPAGIYSDPSADGSDGPHSYHDVAPLPNGLRVPFAVVLDTGGGLAATTTAAAHQLIDAVTDPFESPQDGYYADPPTSDPWSLVAGEVADLCEGEGTVAESGYALPRVYSNAAVAAGTGPCKPFIADGTWCDVSAKPSQMPTIPPGGTATFELTGWSTKELPNWMLSTQDVDRSRLRVKDMQPDLSSHVINNNTTVTITLHAPKDAIPGTVAGLYVLSGDHPWAIGFIVGRPN